jgi:hypothetical protein
MVEQLNKRREEFDSEYLDRLLDNFGDLGKEGHIMISPRIARAISLNWLLEEYRDERAAWKRPTNAKIEVLVQMAGDSPDPIDFTQLLEKLEAQRVEEAAKRESFWSALNRFLRR